MKTYAQVVKNRKGRRGAVALEYILIASLVAIALMGAFLYFRKTLDTGVREMTDVAAKGIAGSVKEAEAGLTTEGSTHLQRSGGGTTTP